MTVTTITTLSLSANGKTVHRNQCRFARWSWLATVGLTRLEILSAIAADGIKECKKCAPLAKCKVFKCPDAREYGHGFCKAHILEK